MAYIFRPTYVRTDPRTGKKVRRKLKKWHIRFRCPDGRVLRVAGYTDKEATRQLAARLEKKAARQQEGMIDPFEEHLKRPLAEHVEDFRSYLKAKGNTSDYAKKTSSRVQAILNGCQFVRLTDVSPSAVVEWLAEERQAGRMSIRTSNYYLRDVKAFSRWMVKDRRAGDNLLGHLSPANVDVEDGLERRTLDPADFATVVAAAKRGQTLYRLTGVDRATLYTVAAFTGLRAGELRSLTPESFDLESESPTVEVEAAYSKRRRKDVQPLRPDLAALLRDYLRDKPAGQAVWPGDPDAPSNSWWFKGADMIRADLEAAGIDFRDKDGQVFDFHALRHQFISSLAAAGVHPKIAQTLARHSTITLTMDRYTHVGLFDQTAALDKLPALPATGSELERMKATGTDGAHSPQHSPVREIPCNSVRTADTERTEMTTGCHRRKTPKFQASEGSCDRMRTFETEEGPRGGTVDTRDLKSLGA